MRFKQTFLGLISALILPSLAFAQYSDDLWDYCAKENRDCQLNGPAQVRFGADGAYVYRRVRGSFRCDVQTFGDPAPGRRKTCEVQRFDQGNYGGYQQEEQGFSDCAAENRLCEARGAATIRYGARGQYVYLDVYNEAVPCDNQTFGDPAPGRKKRCEIRYEGYNQQGYGNQGYGNQGYGQPSYPPNQSFGNEWVDCAGENQLCNVPGPAIVRFGSDGSYATQQTRGRAISCDLNTFGDPAPRRKKRCSYQLTSQGYGNQGYGNSGYGNQGGAWVECAREEGYCQFSGRRAVRFGDGRGRDIVREFRNGASCTLAAFGSDPAPGKKKICAIESGY